MNHRRLFDRAGLVFLIFVFILSSGLTAPPVSAQEGARLRITRLDTSRLPEVTADVAVQDNDGKAITTLKPADFQISENGQPARSPAVTPEKIGLQVAIIIDASGSINQPGLTTDANKNPRLRIDEVREALSEMLLGDRWIGSAERLDWVTILVQEEKEYKVLTMHDVYPQGWTNDYQLAYNSVYLYDSTPRKGDTPLFDAVFEAIRRMDDVPAEVATRGMQRALIIFSDGVDMTSNLRADDAIASAQAKNIAIHTVLLGKPSSEEAARNQRRLAITTGGLYTQYSGLETVQTLFESLVAKRNQYRIRYQMTAPGKHDLEIKAVISADGKTVSDRASITFPPPPLPVVAVTAPAAGIVLEKYPTQVVEPLAVNLGITWPDNRPREIAEVQYYLDNTQFSVTQPPFDQFSLPTDKLAAGPHSVRAVVRDEYGLTADTQPVIFEVRGLQPLAISFVQPPAGTVIRRESRFFWAKANTLEPLTQLVQIEWRAPDSRPRNVKSVQYLVDGQPYEPMAGTLNAFEWNISELDSGVHILQVRLEDALGFVAESNSLPISLQVVIPPAPPITSWLALAAALAALSLALYVFIRKPEIVTNVAGTVARTVRDITEPFRPKLADDQKRRAGAFLTVEEGETAYPNPIPLASGNIRMGRDPGLVTIQLQDRSVSRLHARITEEQDGTYHIYDEGSTSGTYVNFQPIPMEGQFLQHNDVIHLGRVRLRFTLAGVRSMPESPKPPSSALDTQSYQPAAPAARTPEPPWPQPQAIPAGASAADAYRAKEATVIYGQAAPAVEAKSATEPFVPFDVTPADEAASFARSATEPFVPLDFGTAGAGPGPAVKDVTEPFMPSVPSPEVKAAPESFAPRGQLSETVIESGGDAKNVTEPFVPVSPEGRQPPAADRKGTVQATPGPADETSEPPARFEW
ncbi:MAG: FHA domain-containing protein [Chloroflexi bacterium]|nr:FHA domain-containing protein [Chloroflexota bacterium]